MNTQVPQFRSPKYLQPLPGAAASQDAQLEHFAAAAKGRGEAEAAAAVAGEEGGAGGEDGAGEDAWSRVDVGGAEGLDMVVF